MVRPFQITKMALFRLCHRSKKCIGFQATRPQHQVNYMLGRCHAPCTMNENNETARFVGKNFTPSLPVYQSQVLTTSNLWQVQLDGVLMPMTHAPGTGARKLVSVSGASVIQSGAEFFWRQILESDRTCSISRQNLETTWSKYWFVIGQWSMLLLFSFVEVLNFVCILDYWNYLTYSAYLTWVGRIAK